MLWNKWVKGMNRVKNTSRVLFIQGTLDNTVDGFKNEKILKSKFCNFKSIIVKNANHHILNESSEIREKVFSEILSY